MITNEAYLDLDEVTPVDDAAEYRTEEAAISQAILQATKHDQPGDIAAELAKVLMGQYKYHDTLERQAWLGRITGLDAAELRFLLDVRAFLIRTRSTLAVQVLRMMAGGQ